MLTLDGKVAIITGAGSGMGRASALLMAARGARVVVADINHGSAEAAANEIRQRNGEAVAVAGDIAEEADWRRVIETAVKSFGGVDILHNNAADLRPSTYGRDASIGLEEMDVALWDGTMAVNLRGTMLGCKHVLPEMFRRGGGSIINVSSNAGLAGQETTMAYGVSKAGVNMLTKYVATAYGPRGVRCNAIAPGLVISAEMKAGLDPAFLGALEANILAPFTGEPEDVAEVAAFLASDGARYVNGEVIRVDGGLMAHAPYYSDIRALRR